MNAKTRDVSSWRDRLSVLLRLRAEGKFSDNLFLADVANLVTPENIDDVMSKIPTESMPLIMKWIEGLRVPGPDVEILWPLPSVTLSCLKQWLKRQETLQN